MHRDPWPRRLLVALADEAPGFRPPAHPADGGFGRRLLVALADAAPAFRSDGARDGARPRTRSQSAELRYLAGMRALLVAVCAFTAVSIAGEATGHLLPRFLLLGFVVVGMAVVIWLSVVRARAKARSLARPIFGDSAVEEGFRQVLATGTLVVAGPHGVGTSAVAEAVIGRLVDAGYADAGRVTRFDLGRPDDLPLIAPRNDVVLLDNATTAEEVRLLIGQLPSGGSPWLVVAGELPVADLIESSAVFVWEGLSTDAVWLLHALAALPAAALSRDEISAVLTGRGQAAGDPLAELRTRNLVVQSDGRYRLPAEIRRALAAPATEVDRRIYALRAVPALLSYYARQATDWAARLGSHAAAVYWFRDAERSLRPLFDSDSYLDADLLDLVIDDLASIAAALERWYVRERESAGLLEINTALYGLAQRADRLDLAGHAESRMMTALLMTGVQFDDPRWRRPPVVAGQKRPWALVSLVSLGEQLSRRGQPGQALEHLRQAEKIAKELGDIDSEALAVDLQGQAIAQGAGTLLDAVPLWQRARNLFARVRNKPGEAVCLHQLAAAALADPRVAGLLRDGQPNALSAGDAALVALPLLRRAKELMTGQPDTERIDEHIRTALTRLESQSGTDT